MNERDSYMLARAFAEVVASRKRRFEYASVNADAVRAGDRPPDANGCLREPGPRHGGRARPAGQGFRWVRTEGELAIFEKEVAR
jgi:hypothetical protein